jgi:hypothetical protein
MMQIYTTVPAFVSMTLYRIADHVTCCKCLQLVALIPYYLPTNCLQRTQLSFEHNGKSGHHVGRLATLEQFLVMKAETAPETSGTGCFNVTQLTA